MRKLGLRFLYFDMLVSGGILLMLRDIISRIHLSIKDKKSILSPSINSLRNNENGNIFFMLFGAVAVVGTLGAVTVSTMRGPLSTMVEVQARTKAESEMAIASRLSMLEATEAADNGDCDGDGFIEPLEYEVGAGPTGGGLLPSSISSSRVDPWGTDYGYCVWDSGTTINDAINCDNNGTAGLQILDGDGSGDDDYTVIAIISAGADQSFQTSCTEGPPSLNKGGDDIVVEFTYASAAAATDGLWDLIDPDTAAISKDLEVDGEASFTGGIDLSSSTAALTLGAASMLFPTDVTLPTCNSANEGLLRLNTTTDPDTLELCDDPTGWVNVGAGGSIWTQNTGDEIYFDSGGTTEVGIGTTSPNDTLDIVGTLNTSGAVDFDSTLNVDGNTTLAGTTVTTLDATGAVDFDTTLNVDGNTTLAGTTATTLGATGAVDFDTTLNVDGASTLADVSAGATTVTTLDATGAVDFDTTLNVDSNATLGGTLDVAGNFDIGGGDFTVDSSNGNTAVGGTLGVSGNATFSSDLIVSSSDSLIPSNCSSTQKLEWGATGGWSCTDETAGPGGTPLAVNLGDLDDVTTTGANTNDCLVKSAGDWVATSCTAAAGTIWEDAGTAIRIANSGSYATDDLVFGSPQLDDDGDANHDNRIFFDKSKGAFRAGNANGTQWDDANVGDYSFAAGAGVTASGNSSTALGSGITASGQSSFVQGGLSVASGEFSVVIGGGFANASGDYSYVHGINSVASGHYSYTSGQSVTASGYAGRAIGIDVQVGDGVAETTAAGVGSYSIGFGMGDAAGTSPQITGQSSFGIFMGDQNGYDLTDNNRFALVGGDFLIDDDGTAGSQGCFRYTEGTGLEFSDDCTTFIALNSISGTPGGNNTQVQYNDNGAFGGDAGLTYDDINNVLTVGSAVVITGQTGAAPAFADLNDLDNVNAASPTDGDCITYDDSSSIWVSASCVSSFIPTSIADADGDTQIQVEESADDDTIRFDTAGTERMVIDNSGNVGIGISTPGSPLEVQSTSVGEVSFMRTTTSGGLSDILTLHKQNNSGSAGLAFRTGTASGNIQGRIYTDSSQMTLRATNNLITMAGGTAAMFIDETNQYVGVGDFSSDTVESMLHVQSGDIRLDGGAANEAGCIRFNDTSDELEFSDDCATYSTFSSLGSAGAINDLTDGLTDYANNNLYLGQGTGGSNGIIANYHINMGIGVNALANIGTGCASAASWQCQYNVALGYEALNDATTATSNIAIGYRALDNATTDVGNTAIGENTLGSLAGGQYHNTVLGPRSATGLTTGGYNVMVGTDVAQSSFTSGSRNTFIGEGIASSLTSGNNNVFIGQGAGDAQTTGSSNILIGQDVEAADTAGSDQLNIGNLIYGDLANGDFIIGSYQLDDTGTGTEDNRMFFDTSKGAFRAGSADGTQWDDANVGTSSIALGRSIITSGNDSAAIGAQVTASGLSSFAIGLRNTAGGQGSFAIGVDSSATNTRSVAIGNDVITSGQYSFGFGLGSTAGTSPTVSAINSFGIFMGDQAGYNLTTPNRMALVGGDFLIDDDGTAGSQGCIRYLEGTGLQFSDDCSTFSNFAGGGGLWTDNTTHITRESFHIIDTGQTSDSASLSDAGGHGGGTFAFYDTDSGALRGGTLSASNVAWDDANIGDNSFGWGQDARASGSGSIALGSNSIASGTNSMALRTNSLASGYGSFAVGWGSQATNNGSYAIGDVAVSSGINSVAFGNEIISSGRNSIGFSAGYDIDASGNTGPTVSGDYSIGFFMGDNDGADLTDANTMAILGGDFIVGSYQLDDTATGNQDNRMFFDTSKGAFRAGTVEWNRWDDANVGNSSAAFGFETMASGTQSFASGIFSEASGAQSFAHGYAATASAARTIAMGVGTTASNTNSMAFGNEVTASGERSLAFGLGWDSDSSGEGNPIVAGNHSVGFFMGDQSGYNLSTANRMALVGGDFLIDDDGTAGSQGCIRYLEGTGLQFSDDCTTYSNFAGGGGLWTDNTTHITRTRFHILDAGETMTTAGFGLGADSGLVFYTDQNALRGGATDVADWNEADIGTRSIAYGWKTKASGTNSVAFGAQTTSDGFASFVAGNQSSATGASSFSAGANSYATGNNSISLGQSTNASAANSIALGREVTTSGPSSMGLGLGTAAGADPIVSGAESFGIFMGDQSGADITDANTMAVLGGDFIVGSYQLDDTGTGTEDNRMYFDKSQGAFRVGGTVNTSWDSANTGLYSIAMGSSGRADGDHSIALGRSAFAQGDNSYAFGQVTIPSGTSNSMAIDLGAQGSPDPEVSGNNSFGIFMGDQSGYDLTTANRMALVGGDFLIDDDGTAGSQGCIRYLEGTGLQFSDDCTTYSNFAGGGSLWTDNTTHISRENFHVLDAGLAAGSTTAGLDGDGTYAFFDPDKASMRGGNITTSSAWQDANIGSNSFAWGFNTEASGNFSFATGWNPVATGESSVAMGSATQAQADNSIALGMDVTVNGINSMGIGLGDATTTAPIVSGANSLGIFMGDQDSVTLSDTDTVSIMGASGGVGIGTVSPEDDLHIATEGGTDAANIILQNAGTLSYRNPAYIGYRSRGTLATPAAAGNSDEVVELLGYAYDGDSWELAGRVAVETEGAIADDDVPGALVFSTRPDGAAGTLAERMRINNAGNVGIGVTTPSEALHVAGNVLVRSGNENDWTDTLNLIRDGTGQYNYLFWHTGAGAPDVSTVNFGLGTDATGGTSDLWLVNPSVTGSPLGRNDAVMRFDDGSTEIYMAGNVGIGTITPDSELHVVGDIRFTGVAIDISDRRLKTDITPLSEKGSLLTRIKEIDTYSFRMKDNEQGQIEYGVMAQELEETFPELVQTANDEMGTKSVSYLGLIAPMIEATKELAAENDTLKAELAARDEKMAAFEAKMEARMAALENDMNGVKIYTGYGTQKAAFGLLLFLAMLGSLGFIVYIRKKGGQA